MMPGGRNSYTRPYNRDEKKALTRRNARKAAMKNIDNASRELARDDVDQSPSEFIRQLDELDFLRNMIEESNRDDQSTLKKAKTKGQDRKANRYKFNKGGAVKGYKGGGCVMSGRGGSFKGVK